ncbi:BQ5605_C004g02619 [Microbotryum silenes-dioicae]|uniref:BQ5605_C004g02619 protein n=1 Tax=Microbotryum silenes-dioicae TaxID=796604 RepID=A0A2X0MBL3_9BASI|nr:BQ5605_C004g02619 [Microbotryum silenes-dioicae]
MVAFDHNTNLKWRAVSRLEHDTKGLVLRSEALKAYIISDDSELDALAVGVQWSAGQKWGSEDGFKIFVADVSRGVKHAPAIQTKVVVCCNSQVPFPTSAGQVPSNDNCPDVVHLFRVNTLSQLFPHGAAADKLRRWAITKQEIEAIEARTGLKLADYCTLNEVFAFMELKSTRGEWYAAEAQALGISTG